MSLDLLGRKVTEADTQEIAVITLLDAILEEMRKTNLHLAIMNDMIIQSTEVET